MSMDYRRQLFKSKKLYDIDGTRELFLDAVRQNVAFHMQNCPDYKKILDREGFTPASLATEDDLCRIPVLPTLFFKSHSLYSMDKAKMKIRATSSGTQGEMSRIGLDRETYRLGLRMVFKTFAYHKVISPVPANYIVLGYEPAGQSQTGAAQTAYGTTKFAPALHREYALKSTGKGYDLNIDGIGRALSRYAKSGFPVRFVGFPGYMYFLVRTLKDRGVRLNVSGLSKVLLGGGWKQFGGGGATKEELYGLIEETLGIPEANCREFFSAVEHPVAYCDCPEHHFHVPVYSRALIRDVDSLMPLPYGETGLLSFITPLVGSMPLVSVVTDDLAVMHEGRECGCGIASPFFEVRRRAGLREIKTCAAGAAEMMGGSR